MRSDFSKDLFMKIAKSPDGTVVTGFDTETTGLVVEKDHLTQVVLIKLKKEKGKWVEKENISTYVKPPVPIDETSVACEKTGITNETVKDAPTFEQLYPKIKEFIKDVDYVIGHNVVFDNRFMSKNFERMNDTWPYNKENSADTLVAARDLISKEEAVNHSHTLENCLKFYNIEVEGSLHDALTDVRGCLAVFNKAVAEYERIDAETKKQWANPNIKPHVTSCSVSMLPFEGSYRKANFLWVNTDCGTWRLDCYTLQWKEWKKIRPCTLESVIRAACEYTGCESEGDLAHWDPKGVRAAVQEKLRQKREAKKA